MLHTSKLSKSKTYIEIGCTSSKNIYKNSRSAVKIYLYTLLFADDQTLIVNDGKNTEYIHDKEDNGGIFKIGTYRRRRGRRGKRQ